MNPPKPPVAKAAHTAAPAAAKPAAKKKELKLDSERLRMVLLGGLAASVLLFIMVAGLGLSFLASKSKAMVELKVKSQAADDQLSSLEQAKKDVQKYSYFKDVAKTVIPNDKDQAEAVLEINRLATKSGISIQSITFPASNLSAGSASSSKTISQAKPVTGISGLYSLELTITPASGAGVPANRQITYKKMLDFLSSIENNRRTAQITSVNIQQAEGNKGLSFTLSINTFIKP